MTPANFLPQLQWLRAGGNGFNRQVPLTVNGIATTGTRALASNSVPADAIVLDADGEDAIVGLIMPLDYDQDLDLLDVSLLVRHVSGTSIAIQADSVSKANATTDLADVSAFVPATATTINAAFDIGLVQANVSKLGLVPGDMIAVNFVASATTGSGIAHIIGAVVTYRGDLVAYVENNRGADSEDTSTNHLNT